LDLPTRGIGVCAVRLDGALSRDVRDRAKAECVSLRVVFFGALALVLKSATQRTSVAIWTMLDNRGRPETDGLIGSVANPHVIQLDLVGADTLGEVLERAARVIGAAQLHQEVPLDLVWRSEGRCWEPIGDHGAHVSFDYIRRDRPDHAALSLLVAEWPVLDTSVQLALQFRSYENRDGFWICATYSKDRFLKDRVEAMLADWNERLRDFARRGVGATAG
jgi:hypothetical protein